MLVPAETYERLQLGYATEREKELSDPHIIDRKVAANIDKIYPLAKKPSMKGFDSKVDALEAALPGDHPLKGTAETIRQNYTAALQDPELAHVEPAQILSAIADGHITPKIIPSYEYKRYQDSSLGNLGGVFGGNEKYKALPGFDKWLTATREEENKKLKEESWLPSGKELLATAATGAAFGGATSALFSGGAAAPLGAVAGAASFAALEPVVRPIQKLLHGTEWYRARKAAADEGSVTDMAKTFMADTLPFIPADMGVRNVAGRIVKSAAKATMLSDAASEMVTKMGRFPSAENIIQTGRAIAKSKAAIKSADSVIDDYLKAGFGAEDAKQVAYRLALEAQDELKASTLNDRLYAISRAGKLTTEEQEIFEASQRRVGVVGKAKAPVDETSQTVDKILADAKVTDLQTLETVGGTGAESAAVRKQKAIDAWNAAAKMDDEAFNAAMERPGNVTNNILREQSNQEAIDHAASRDRLRSSIADREANTPPGGSGGKAPETVLYGPVIKTAEEQAKASAAVSKKLSQYGYITGVEGTTAKVAGVTEVKAAASRAEISKANKLTTTIKPSTVEQNYAKFLKDLGDKWTSESIGIDILDTMEEQGISPKTVSKNFWNSVYDDLPEQAKKKFDKYVTRLTGDSTTPIKEQAAILTDDFPVNVRHLEGIERGYVSLMQYGNELTAKTAKTTAKTASRAEQLEQESTKIYNSGIEAKKKLEGLVKPEDLSKLSHEEAIALDKELNEFYDEVANLPGPREIHTAPNTFELQKSIDSGFDDFKEQLVAMKAADADEKSPTETVGKTLLYGFLPAVLLGNVAINAISPPEAHAGLVDAVLAKPVAAMAKNAIGSGAKNVIEGMDKAHLLDKALPEGAKSLPEGNYFQEQLKVFSKDSMREAGIRKTIQAITRTKALPFRIDKMLSPQGISQVYYKQNFSPAVQLASAAQAIQNNTRKGLQLVYNILDDVPGFTKSEIKMARKEVSTLLDPLAKRYHKEVTPLGAIEFDIIAKEKILESYAKVAERGGEGSIRAKRMIGTVQGQLEKLYAAKDVMTPIQQQWEREWTETVQGLAKKYPTTRVALAAEDTADFKKYPWLKDMMSRDEIAAVSHLKRLNETYAGRIVATGQRVITSEPYMHHAWHPSWDESQAAARLAELNLNISSMSTPMSKFFQRTKYSRQLMPEAQYIMERYIPDAEKRIQLDTFWDKKNPNGWYRHRRSDAVQSNAPLRDFWQRVRDSAVPPPNTATNVWANRYASLEVLRLIGFSPSVGLKHLFKEPGSIASLGLGSVVKNTPEALKVAVNIASRDSSNAGLFKWLGVRGNGVNKTVHDFASSFIQTNKYMQNIIDFDLTNAAKLNTGYMDHFDNFLSKVNQKGSFIVSGVEMFDRAATVLAGLDMAAKKGLTGQQAAYGILDTVLKNNFMSGMLNPIWMKDPKVRALFLFANTPFKILERRMVLAYQTKNAVKTAFGVVRGDKQIIQHLTEMRRIKGLIQEGETAFKSHLIKDALTVERDIFGTPATKQFMRELLLYGSLLAGGAAFGVDLSTQIGHVPFVHMDRKEPSLAINPLAAAFFKTKAERVEAYRNDNEPDFIVTSFMKNWLGKSFGVPVTANKLMRLSNDDIPEQYKGSKWQYLFAVPSRNH